MDCTKHSVRKPETDKIHVLIAEDEAMIALSLCDLLEAEGYQVTTAADGAEALVEAARLGASLDALITDLNMPRMSGEDLIRTILTGRPKLPVLVVTGSAPPGGLDELRRISGGSGPLALFHKPLNHADLVHILRCAVFPKLPLPVDQKPGRQ